MTKRDEAVSQLIREHGGCGVFIDDSNVCIREIGHDGSHDVIDKMKLIAIKVKE